MNEPQMETSCLCDLLFKDTRFEPMKKRVNCFCDRYPHALLTVALAAMPIGMIAAVFAVTALFSLPLLLVMQAMR